MLHLLSREKAAQIPLMLHDVFHIGLLVLFFTAIGAGFLGLIRPLIDAGADLKLPGPKATAFLFLAALVAGAADWLLHRYII